MQVYNKEEISVLFIFVHISHCWHLRSLLFIHTDPSILTSPLHIILSSMSHEYYIWMSYIHERQYPDDILHLLGIWNLCIFWVILLWELRSWPNKIFASFFLNKWFSVNMSVLLSLSLPFWFWAFKFIYFFLNLASSGFLCVLILPLCSSRLNCIYNFLLLDA